MSKDDDDFEVIDGSNNRKSSTGLDENIAGFICYLGGIISGIVFLILEKKSNLVKFHALQSTLLFLGLWLAGFVAGLIPIVGGLIGWLLSVLSFILWIVLMVKTYQKEEFEVPIVSNLVRNLLRNR